MPYIYSLAWRVTNEDYTIQRPLVMDWRTDPKVRDIGDQFMFGPSILVSPVLRGKCDSQDFVSAGFSCVVRLLDRSIAKGWPRN